MNTKLVYEAPQVTEMKFTMEYNIMSPVGTNKKIDDLGYGTIDGWD